MNNAARIVYKPVVGMTRGDWDYVMETNVTRLFLHSREAANLRIKEERSDRQHRVLRVLFRFPDHCRRHLLKEGVGAIDPDHGTGACRTRHSRDAIGTGDVVTRLLNSFMEDGPGFLTEHGKGAPIGRAAQPSEIVAFLASDRASFIVGSIVMADGGYSVQIK
ncbi:Dihydroanticapsin 7-dehydrogenase [compost metagenome]